MVLPKAQDGYAMAKGNSLMLGVSMTPFRPATCSLALAIIAVIILVASVPRLAYSGSGLWIRNGSYDT